MNKFYQLAKSEVDSDTTELLIHGDITSYKWAESDVGSFDLAQELMNVTTPNLLVRINSYGGEVSQGLGIYNLLKSFKGKVITVNDGFACSAASIVFMAGEERVMPRSTLLLIHNAWSIAQGDSNDFKKMAEDLEKITQPSVEIYKKTSNLSEEEIKKMMDAETWITADEALSYGFATKVQDDEKKQSLDNHYLFKLVMKIKEYENKTAETTPPTKKDAWTSFFTKGN